LTNLFYTIRYQFGSDSMVFCHLCYFCFCNHVSIRFWQYGVLASMLFLFLQSCINPVLTVWCSAIYAIPVFLQSDINELV